MKPTKKMHMRVYIILFLVVIIGFGTVFGSLVNIQIFKGKEYRDLASEQQLRDTVINPTRGDITNRNGNVLATPTRCGTSSSPPTTSKTTPRGN